jgi:ADP-heptose:LPS heptosyltransferase
MIIFLPNGYGDLIMSLPALNYAIKKIGAENVSIVVLSPSHKKLVEFFLIHNIVIFVRKDFKLFSQIRLFFKLFFSSHRIIVAPLLSSKLVNKIFFFLLPKKKFLPQKTFFSSQGGNFELPYSLNSFHGHEVNYLINCVAFAICEDPIYVKFLDLKIPIKKINNDKVKICIGMCCGEFERHKVPGPEYYARLVNLINEKFDVEFYVLATKADTTTINNFYHHLHPEVDVRLLKDYSFEQLADILPACDLGVSGMSGQGHLLSAFSLPMVIFSGVTNPRESAPYVERAVVLSHKFACGPCYQEKFLQGCRSIECMDSIDPFLVIDAIKFLLKDNSHGKNWHQLCNQTTLTIKNITSLLGKINV